MRHRGDSRPAIPDDNAPVAPAHSPTRWTVRRVRSIAYILFGLAVAASLMSVYLTYRTAQDSSARAAAVDRRLSVLEQDLADRTRQRDAERDAATAQAEADREQFRVRFCEILGELSATFPNLVPVEQALRCAPLTAAASSPATASSAPPRPPVASRPPPAPSPSPPATAQPPASPSPTPAPPRAPTGGSGPLCGLLPALC